VFYSLFFFAVLDDGGGGDVTCENGEAGAWWQYLDCTILAFAVQ